MSKSIYEKYDILRGEYDNQFKYFSNTDEKCEVGNVNVTVGTSKTNVVPREVLRVVQKETLEKLQTFLSMTFGPMGSNTKIITGNNKDTISSSYSKDGLKVLKNISDAGPIEMSIIEELINITRSVEKEVGDGTTSTVILSSLIFNRLINIQKKHNIPPFQLIRTFDKVVDEIKQRILASGQECTLNDIYDISMISTNGNDIVSNNIKSIYEQYGMDVDLTVGISNSVDSVVKVYDGLTITEGMSDPVYITNKAAGTSEIHNAKIYHFADPIDTMEMIMLFESILSHNIYEPYENDEAPIPTVIVCPRLSKDMSATLKSLAQQLYQFDQKGAESAKPPILIISNVVASDELIMDDIANLCGCKSIRKYIDPKIYKKDVESGMAATVENVWEFSGEAELVISDSKKTKFINPKHMRQYDEDGNAIDDPIYTAMVNFLETEIENMKATDNPNELGLLKKRLSALKANMVEYLVGGITVSERDATKDLVEDAIKNCKSAAKYGVGRAANFEGLIHSLRTLKSKRVNVENLIEEDIAGSIFGAYCDITEILYGTVSNDKNEIKKYLYYSLENGNPYNISSGSLPNLNNDFTDVKCSIMLDINILNTLSKIITIMVTCNQCLLQAPQLNTY